MTRACSVSSRADVWADFGQVVCSLRLERLRCAAAAGDFAGVGAWEFSRRDRRRAAQLVIAGQPFFGAQVIADIG